MKGIYLIKNKINNKLYIGKSMNLLKRKREHLNKLRNNKHENSKLQNAFNKYGEENFLFEILIKDESLSENELYDLERIYTYLFDTKDRGYNLCYGGKGGSTGWKASELQRLIRSFNSTGANNPFYNKKVTPENRKKMTEGLRKVVKTQQYRNKMSEVMKGRKFTEEHSRNKSKAQTGGKNPIARKCIVDGVVYECVKDVAKYYGIPQNTASYRLKSKTFENWQYIDEGFNRVITYNNTSRMKQTRGNSPNTRKCIVEGINYDCIMDIAEYYGISYGSVRYRINSNSEKFREWRYL